MAATGEAEAVAAVDGGIPRARWSRAPFWQRRSVYTVVLDVFEGPLDLLLHLITRQQLDIADIPIARVTEQYLAYLDAMAELDLDVASEFLVMAATLMEIKARMLLPAPPPAAEGEEEPLDPRAELVARLVEYRRYKEAAEALARRQEAWSRRVLRAGPGWETGPACEGTGLDGVTLLDLLDAFQAVLARTGPAAVREVRRPEISIRQRMAQLLRRLRRHRQGLPFSALLRGRRVTRGEVVVTFLALLECVRRGYVVVQQALPFAEIYCYLRTAPAEGGA